MGAAALMCTAMRFNLGGVAGASRRMTLNWGPSSIAEDDMFCAMLLEPLEINSGRQWSIMRTQLMVKKLREDLLLFSDHRIRALL